MNQPPASQPLVSVLMPTYNRERHVGVALRSVFAQTVADMEIVVVDDGSTDRTREVVASFGDPRVRLVQHERNRGEAGTRNTLLDEARGRYIAWLDSDDVARPNRLAVQLAFLERHPEVAMVGSATGKIADDGQRLPGKRLPPLDNDLIAAWLLFRSAFQQSSLTGRAEVLKRYRYDPGLPICTDLDMFVQLQRHHQLANVPDVLIDRRLHPGQMVRQMEGEIVRRKAELAVPALRRLGVDPTADELRRHALLGKAKLTAMAVSADFLPWARTWLERLRVANTATRAIDPDSLAVASGYVWMLACRAIGGAAGARALLGSRLALGLVSGEGRRWAAQALPALLTR